MAGDLDNAGGPLAVEEEVVEEAPPPDDTPPPAFVPQQVAEAFVNTDPTAEAVIDDMGEDDLSVTVDLAAAIDDGDAGQTLGLSVDTGTTGWTATLNGTQVTFTPPADADYNSMAVGESQDFAFSYTVDDGAGGEATSQVTVTVKGENDGPTVTSDIADQSASEGSSISLDVSGNFDDVDTSDTLTYQATLEDGSDLPDWLSINPTTGVIGGTPPAGVTAETLDITVTATDPHGATASDTFEVDVQAVNDTPDAVDDAVTIDENAAAISINVLTNDSDPDGDALTVETVSVGTNQGTVSIVNNQVSFDPGTDFDSLEVGETTTVDITYTISDGNGGTDTATATVTITGENDGPKAVADTAATTENAAVTIDVLANDTDIDNNADLSVASATVAAGEGSVSIVNDQVVFDPGTDFDSLEVGETTTVDITYTVTDEHGATSEATATVTITGENDGPVAKDDSATTEENTSIDINVLANDTDIDNNAELSVVSATVPTGEGSVSLNTDGTVAFDPGTDFDSLAVGESATVDISYTITDEHGATSEATATVTVTGSNDAPEVSGPVNLGTTEEDGDAFVVTEAQLLANASDIDTSDTLNAENLTATNATVVDNGNGTWTVTPNPDFSGTVSLSYDVADGTTTTPATATATVTATGDVDLTAADLTVAEDSGPIDLGLAVDITDVDGSEVVTDIQIQFSDVPTGAQFSGGTYNETTGVWQGSEADLESLEVSPPENFVGDFSGTLTVTSNEGASSQEFSVTVTGENDPPVVTLQPIEKEFTEGDNPVKIAPSAQIEDIDSLDFDGGELTVSLDNAQADDVLSFGPGSISVQGNELHYPGPNGDVIGTFEGGSDGEDLVITFNENVTPDVAEQVLKQVTFENTSEDPVEGDRSIDITLTDGDGGTSQTVSVTVDVEAINDDPTAQALTGGINEDDLSTTVDVTAFIDDVDNTLEELTITADTGATGWTASVDGKEITFNPPAGAYDQLAVGVFPISAYGTN